MYTLYAASRCSCFISIYCWIDKSNATWSKPCPQRRKSIFMFSQYLFVRLKYQMNISCCIKYYVFFESHHMIFYKSWLQIYNVKMTIILIRKLNYTRSQCQSTRSCYDIYGPLNGHNFVKNSRFYQICKARFQYIERFLLLNNECLMSDK